MIILVRGRSRAEENWAILTLALRFCSLKILAGEERGRAGCIQARGKNWQPCIDRTVYGFVLVLERSGAYVADILVYTNVKQECRSMLISPGNL